MSKNFLELLTSLGPDKIQLLSDPRHSESFNRANVISSGILAIDIGSGIGGFCTNRIIEVFGWESCLSKDSFIKFSTYDLDGKKIDEKGGTIKNFYEKFNRKGKFAKDSPKWNKSKNAFFTVPSVNSDGCIFSNIVENVFFNGYKKIYLITTTRGHAIKATSMHRFMDKNGGFVRVKDMNEGDVILVHENITYNKEAPPRINRKEICVKHHPVWKEKIVDGKYPYKRAYYSRCVYEAFMNGISVTEYISRLNNGYLVGLVYLDENTHIHHIDENPLNDSIENLMPISPQKHGKLHSFDRMKNLSFVVSEDTIESIECVGIDEVYDICVESPHKNYVANKFVVHNSGKSTLALQACAQFNKKDKAAVYIDVEHAVDIDYAKKLGINPKLFSLSQPNSGEEAIEIAVEASQCEDVGIYVLDSVAALMTKQELEGDLDDANIGATARMMGRAMRKLSPSGSVHNTMGLFLNQNREKPGVMFGSPIVQPGGKALRFAASMRIELTRTSTNKEGKESISNETRAKFVKNKLSIPFKEVTFNIVFGKGADNIETILDKAVEQNILEKKGTMYSYGDTILGRGKKEASKFLKADKALTDEIWIKTVETYQPKTKPKKAKATRQIQDVEDGGATKSSLPGLLMDE